MDKQVVKKNSAGALVSVNFRADAGKGAEEIKSDDVSTPILKILHQLSPECNSRSAKHVEGAEPGMIYSNSFGKPMDGNEGIEVLVAKSMTRWPEWQELGDSPSAPVATHLTVPADAEEEIRGIKYRLPNGNYVEKTIYFFVIVKVEGQPRKALITMRSSNLTPARRLNDIVSGLSITDEEGTYQASTYSAFVKLQTAEKSSGDKTWHVYKPSLLRMVNGSDPVEADFYEKARKLHAEVNSGDAKPKYEKAQSQTEDIA